MEQEIARTKYNDRNFSYRKIGEGGFGSCYVLENKEEGSFSALKIIIDSKIEKVEKEADKLKKCKIPYSPKLIEFTGYDKKLKRPPTIRMDFIPGMSLSNYIETVFKKGTINDGKFLKIAILLAYEIYLLHKKETKDSVPHLHRDIKPSNVILDGNYVPHLIDFGEMCVFNDDKTGIHGTTNFMCKEAFQAEKDNFYIDVYAYACVLFNMVAGFAPFQNQQLSFCNQYYPRMEMEKCEIASQIENSLVDSNEGFNKYIEYIVVELGKHDETFEKESKCYKNLPQIKKRIIDIVNDIFINKSQYSSDDSMLNIIGKLKDVALEFSYEDIDDIFTSLETLEKCPDEIFGNKKYLFFAKNAGFDAYEGHLTFCLKEIDHNYKLQRDEQEEKFAKDNIDESEF